VAPSISADPAVISCLPANEVSVPSVTEIFREHGAFVWRLLRRLGVPSADLDDLTQEVFLIVHRSLPSYEEQGRLKGWLYRICVRTANQHRRKRLPSVSLDVDPLIHGVEANPEEAVQQSQARATFERLLSLLDEDRRTVFVLYEVEELPMAEVAKAIGCPLQTAYSRLHAARSLLADAMRRQEASQRLR
jgi:RNA polymerase sigma-70 factor, ECF subfamily